ncbi:helix-turn-helix transcriptional regulator [Micromonospora sp. NPDC049559]|uniref:helix-turn-helix domain-containing protein n=1 Tax=Micromonospora sp. NPDC049559 TaxID=3155923 RepID=UPI00342F3844
MPDTRPGLARRVGRLLRAEREAAGLSQEALAARVGLTQQQVSRFEHGGIEPTTGLIERLFDGLGQQLRLDVEARDADLDASIDAALAEFAAAELAAQRRRAEEDGGGEGGEDDEEGDESFGTDTATLLLRDLDVLLRRAPELAYLIDGELAAALQRVPLRPTRIEVAVAGDDLPALADWIESIPNCLRWVERWRDFSGYDRSPLRPGPLRWMTPFGELRARLLPRLPPAVVVTTADGHGVPVRPLVEVQREDPHIARVIARAAARGLFQSTLGRRTVDGPATVDGQSTVGRDGPSTSSASTIV